MSKGRGFQNYYQQATSGQSNDYSVSVGGYGRGRPPMSNFASRPPDSTPLDPNQSWESRNYQNSHFDSSQTPMANNYQWNQFAPSQNSGPFMGGRGKGRGRDPDRLTSTGPNINNAFNDLNRDFNNLSTYSNNDSKGRAKPFGSTFNNLDTPDFAKTARDFSAAECSNNASKYSTPSAATDSCNSGTGATSGFGFGFPAMAARPDKRPKPDESGLSGGFMDWETVQKEMERAEIARWAGLPKVIKNFYQEDPAITAMSEDEADKFRLSKNNIMVQDLKLKRVPPKPVINFEHAFKNQPQIMEEIAEQGFKEPSPIQCQMWPTTLSGYDVIGIAQTGTGKTLAFLLPIFIHLENQPLPRHERKGPGCLILSPTRELALQIHSEVKKYRRYNKMKSVCLYGGGDRKKQVDSVLEGVDIVIATPGRLNDLVCDGVVKLKTITFVVLDEADRMLDMGFEPQIKIVLNSVRPDRQTVLTSATWPPEVRRMAENYTKDPFLIVVGSMDLSACHNVTQVIEVVRDEEKRERLFEFLLSLKEDEKIIVFVGKKSLVDDLASDLIRMGVQCQSIHGDRDQGDRERALSDLRDGSVRILIATDVASRGLDIVDITHVFNYDFPRQMEEYVHRVGRTGRAGRSGVSITFVTRYDWRSAGGLIKILEDAKQDVPDELRRMAERWEQKLKENPEMGNRRAFFREKKQPFFMEDYI